MSRRKRSETGGARQARPETSELAGNKERPQGDSNSCRQLEKPDTLDVTNGGGETCEHATPARSNTDSNSTAIDPDDADLRAVVDARPMLAEPVRAGILAMVRASKGDA